MEKEEFQQLLLVYIHGFRGEGEGTFQARRELLHESL
jgi:hypothetical protein